MSATVTNTTTTEFQHSRTAGPALLLATGLLGTQLVIGITFAIWFAIRVVKDPKSANIIRWIMFPDGDKGEDKPFAPIVIQVAQREQTSPEELSEADRLRMAWAKVRLQSKQKEDSEKTQLEASVREFSHLMFFMKGQLASTKRKLEIATCELELSNRRLKARNYQLETRTAELNATKRRLAATEANLAAMVQEAATMSHWGWDHAWYEMASEEAEKESCDYDWRQDWFWMVVADVDGGLREVIDDVNGKEEKEPWIWRRRVNSEPWSWSFRRPVESAEEMLKKVIEEREKAEAEAKQEEKVEEAQEPVSEGESKEIASSE